MSCHLKGLSDTDLALLAQKGDRSAFGEIYDRHASGIARALASFAGPDPDMLDDLTHEAFFKAIDGLAAYVPSHPFTHWLYTIALNVGRNHVRRRSKMTFVDPAEFEHFASDHNRSNNLSEEIIGQTLVQLVARLPDHMREVVSLRIGSGMSYGEIAEVLEIPEGTARSRMHNAIKDIRKQLQTLISKKERK